MDKKLKKEWVKALRSGDYQQGKSRLCTETKDGPKFCCLGVLCDIAFDETEAYWHRESKGGGWKFCKDGTKRKDAQNSDSGEVASNEANRYLPDWARKELGIDSETQIDLGSMNDRGVSFKELANHIEKNL